MMPNGRQMIEAETARCDGAESYVVSSEKMLYTLITFRLMKKTLSAFVLAPRPAAPNFAGWNGKGIFRPEALNCFSQRGILKSMQIVACFSYRQPIS